MQVKQRIIFDDGIRRIYQIENPDVTTYVISSHDIWLPGSYESEETAIVAFDLDYEILLAIQREAVIVTADGIIKMDMLERYKNVASH